jgi:hypothetical protein
MTGPPGAGAPGPAGPTGPAGAAGATGGSGSGSNIVKTGQVASPISNVSTTETAAGIGFLGAVITPLSSGRVFVIFSGMVLNSMAAGDGVTITGRYGIAPAPTSGATSGLGTQWSIPQHFIASTPAGQQGFCLQAIVSGLTLGAQAWFDITLTAVTAGGATVKDVQFTLIEI